MIWALYIIYLKIILLNYVFYFSVLFLKIKFANERRVFFMHYRQSNIFQKMIEPTILFIALFFLSILTDFLTPTYEYFLLLFITLIISSRYGISIALFAFLEAMIYIFISGIYKENDVLLYFYSLDYWISWIFLLVISLCCGLMSTAQKERYEDVHMINNELKAENKELKYVVKQLDETRITLRSRVLESNNHLSKMYHMFKALNHTHPEIVLDEGMNVLKMYFGAKKLVSITLITINNRFVLN